MGFFYLSQSEKGGNDQRENQSGFRRWKKRVTVSLQLSRNSSNQMSIHLGWLVGYLVYRAHPQPLSFRKLKRPNYFRKYALPPVAYVR
mmetsp:Transcript_7082/g.10167  ORF Transcript_7082/g.10167 Transcript_7082/m.10167 type:complete len:88 (-) Transcript_7082:116-379(-)